MRSQQPTVQLSLFDYLALLKELDEAVPRILKEEPEESVPWTKWEVEYLHVYLLDESLRALKRATLPERDRNEILRWLRKPLALEADAFSFQACCIFAGVNAAEMQEQVLLILKRNNLLPAFLQH